MVRRDGWFDALERRTSTLYLVAAAAMVVFATNTALRTYQGTSFAPVQQFVAPAGFLLGVLGLAGSYPALATRARYLARTALAVAAVCGLNWALIVAAGVLETAGVVPENETFTAVTGFVALVSMVLAYGLFGVTSLRTGAYRRVVSGLLLLEAVTFVAMIANAVAALGVPVVVFEVSHLVAYLGLGVILRDDGDPAAPADPASDPTA